MNEQVATLHSKTWFTLICIAILYLNINTFGWCYSGSTSGILSNYSNNEYGVAIDVVKYPDPNNGSDFWIAGTYYDFGVGYEVTKIHCNQYNTADAPTVERFGAQGDRPNLAPGFCINRVDGIPQLLGFNNSYYNLAHYWRDPSTGQWIQQHVLNTISIGPVAMICNRIPPYNLEVVYMAEDGQYRCLWRGEQNDWYEDHSLLPLPSNCHAWGDPVMTQTANGRIHVAAIVCVGDLYGAGSYFTIAHWARDAHVGGDWNQAVLLSPNQGVVQVDYNNVPTMKRIAIISLEQTGYDVVILCNSESSYLFYTGGFKTDYYCNGNDLELIKYPCELGFSVNGWDAGIVNKLAGVANGNDLCLTVTRKVGTIPNASYSNFFIITHCAASNCQN